MRRWRLLLVLAAFLPLAHAQTPSPENATFYGRADCDNQAYGISVIAQSTDTNCGTGSPGASFTWTMAEDPAASVDLLLEEGGDVPMTVWVGSNTHGGNVDVTSTVSAGSSVVATATGSAQYAGAAGITYVEVSMTGTAQVAQVTDPLTWTVTVEGAFTSIFMRFEDGRWSQFTLPITGLVNGGGGSDDPPRTVYENLSAAPQLDLSFTNETVTHVYNWTQAEGLVRLVHDVNGTGNVTATLLDGNGTVVLAQSLAGNGSADVSAAQPGNWSLTLSMSDFTGNVSLSFDTGAPPDGTDTMTNGTGDADTGTERGKDSPGLPLAAMLAVFALLVRRRF